MPDWAFDICGIYRVFFVPVLGFECGFLFYVAPIWNFSLNGIRPLFFFGCTVRIYQPVRKKHNKKLNKT